MMDVSGSMGKEQKDIVRIEAFWIDTWLRHQYKNLECATSCTTRRRRKSTATRSSTCARAAARRSARPTSCALQIMRDKFPAEEWNIYPFHFSDGDNWSTRDTERTA
jgi:uncharacterized sporulation protein YeaH/YhbH (DUF444 family)